MKKTLKTIAIENADVMFKKMELQAIIKKNQMENQVIEIIAENLSGIVFNVYGEPSDKPVFEFYLDEDECSSHDEEVLYQNAIMLLAESLSSLLKKEGFRLDIARIDNQIKFSLFNYVNELVRKENEHLIGSYKDKLSKELNKEGSFNKRMVLHCAKAYISEKYDLDKSPWESVPNHEKIDEILDQLYVNFVKGIDKDNVHSDKSKNKMIELIKTYKLNKKMTLDYAIETGQVFKL